MAGDEILAGRLFEFCGIFVLQGLELAVVVFGILLVVPFVGRIGFGQGVSNVPYFLLGVDQAEPDVRVIVAVFVDLFFIGEFDGRNALRGIDGVERRIFSGIDDFRCPGSMPRPLYTKSCD